MGWAIVVGCTKRQFQITNLLKVDSKSKLKKKKNILQVVMFQNVLMDPKILKGKQIFFFSMSFGIFVSFQIFFWNLCVFSISYKHKYVLFYLNMLRLFQEINMLIFFEIKLVSNRKFFLKYLIQGFNPHLFN